MRYKAKTNLYNAGRQFVAGEIYDEKEVKGIEHHFEKIKEKTAPKKPKKKGRPKANK